MNRSIAWRVLSGLSVCGVTGGIVYVFRESALRASPSRRAPPAHTGPEPGTDPTPRPGLPPHGSDPNVADLQLTLVQVFFRHGARTPLRHMPKLEEVHYDARFLLHQLAYTDIPIEVRSLHGGPRPPSPMDKRYGQVTFKNGVTAGQLTALGQDQVYCLGRHLRRDYPTLIEKTFDPQHVWIQSTNITRCIESLKCVLSGIYGAASFRHKDPVIIHVASFKEETLHPNLRSCPTLRVMEKRVREREADIPGVKDITNRINQVLVANTVKSLAHRNDSRNQCCTFQRAQIQIYSFVHGLPVPQFLLDLEEQIESGATNMLLTYMSGLPEDQPHALRLTVGRALHQVQLNMENQVADPSNPMTLYLFSCHDSTLTPLLKALDGFNGSWPPYAADLRFELYEDKQGAHWVRTRYVNQDLCIGGHKKTILSLDEFKKVLSPYVIDRKDYMKQCSLSQSFWDALDDAVDDAESPVPENM